MNILLIFKSINVLILPETSVSSSNDEDYDLESNAGIQYEEYLEYLALNEEENALLMLIQTHGAEEPISRQEIYGRMPEVDKDEIDKKLMKLQHFLHIDHDPDEDTFRPNQ